MAACCRSATRCSWARRATSPHALKVWGFTPELGILAGTAGAAGLGVITGVVAIRRQGIYFAMITLALSQLLYFIYLQTPFTHGEDGIQGIPQGYLFGIFNLAKPTILYYVILVGFLFGFLVIFRTINSPFGEVLKAIRENEPRAISLGYKTRSVQAARLYSVWNAGGISGSLKVFVAQNASLTDVHWSMSGEIVLMTLVGGLGSVSGPVVGAFVIIAMQQYLAGFGQWVTVIQCSDLCRLRADVPPRRDRRDRALFPAVPLNVGNIPIIGFTKRWMTRFHRQPATRFPGKMVYDRGMTGRPGQPFPQ